MDNDDAYLNTMSELEYSLQRKKSFGTAHLLSSMLLHLSA